MKKYLYIFKSEFMSNLSYIFNTIVGFAGYIILIFIFLNLWKYIYSDPNEVINGYTLNQMIWYVIITELLWTSLKGRKLVKEYLAENVDSYVKEKDYKGILKIIGETEVTKKLNFRVHRISENTKGLIEKAGGTVEILNIRTYSAIAGNNKKDGEK